MIEAEIVPSLPKLGSDATVLPISSCVISMAATNKSEHQPISNSQNASDPYILPMFVSLKNIAEILSSCSHVEKHWQLHSICQFKLLLKVPDLKHQVANDYVASCRRGERSGKKIMEGNSKDNSLLNYEII